MNLLIKNSNKIYFILKKKKQVKPRRFLKFQKNNFIFPENIDSKDYKPYSDYGILRIITNKRNIFCTLSDLKGNIYASISSGLLKVKGRKRQAIHIVRATGQLIINQIFKHKIKILILIHKGKSYEKKKKTLLKTFAKVKKFQFLKVQRPVPRCHNGCRSPKIRRK